MEDAGLYAGHNSLQRQGIEAAIRAHWHRMRWAEEGERALDVGCGTGDVTGLRLLPSLPPNSTIVGIDKSSKMVEYAKSNYETENVHFKMVDFSINNITNVLEAESFSKIFSFYCFLWIGDQRQVGINLSELLRPGGEFLVVNCPTSPVFDIYRILAKTEPWSTYMHDVDHFINDSADVCGEARRTLESAGLDVIACDFVSIVTTFPNMRELMLMLEAINPFVSRMSAEVRKQFMACLEQVSVEHWINERKACGSVVVHNPTLIIYGRKPDVTE